MQITCPSCAAQYDAPDAAFPIEGRVVECSACGARWLQPGPAAPAAAGDAAPRVPGLAEAAQALAALREGASEDDDEEGEDGREAPAGPSAQRMADDGWPDAKAAAGLRAAEVESVAPPAESAPDEDAADEGDAGEGGADDAPADDGATLADALRARLAEAERPADRRSWLDDEEDEEDDAEPAGSANLAARLRARRAPDLPDAEDGPDAPDADAQSPASDEDEAAPRPAEAALSAIAPPPARASQPELDAARLAARLREADPAPAARGGFRIGFAAAVLIAALAAGAYLTKDRISAAAPAAAPALEAYARSVDAGRLAIRDGAEAALELGGDLVEKLRRAIADALDLPPQPEALPEEPAADPHDEGAAEPAPGGTSANG
ncbi:zinc-ribbon domain-containing protein [Oceanicella actignis]|uniref:zinc-ribbon domain-containing protein n=1 Tax=Oceanicella actignis TaxID=1189325 RepID=UPI0011E893D4|nr:zinc-ribbon domain-containing protein [Oceanicella actignis]TYO91351.1 Meckel syndrome type 1 protein [Oceanicella actignis]